MEGGIKRIWERLAGQGAAEQVARELGGGGAGEELLAAAGYAGKPAALLARLRSELGRALPLYADARSLAGFRGSGLVRPFLRQAHRQAAEPLPARPEETPRPAGRLRLGHEERRGWWPLASGQRSLRLAAAYRLSDDPELALAAMRSLRRFCRHHPPLMGPGWAMSEALAARALNWLFALRLLDEALAPEGDEGLDVLLHLRLLALVLDEQARAGGGPAAPAAAALLFLGRCLPFLPEAAAWLQTGCETLGPALAAWRGPDAGDPGRAVAACAFGGLGVWLGGRAGLELPGASAGLRELAGLCRALAPPWGPGSGWSRPYGPPALGWGGDGPGDGAREAANLAAMLLSEPGLRAARKLDLGLLLLLGPQAPERLRALAGGPDPEPLDHPGAGLSVLCARAAGVRVRAVLRTGPRNGGDCAPPAEALALTLALDGRWLLEPPGPAGEGPLSSHLASRLAQSAAVVDRGEAGPGRVELESLEDGEERAFMAASFDGYGALADPVRLRRRVFIDGRAGLVNLVDQVQAAGEHELTVLLRMPVEAKVESGPDGLTVSGGFGKILVRPDPKARVGVVRGRSDPPLGWRADGRGGMQPSPVIVQSARTVGGARLSTVIVLSP